MEKESKFEEGNLEMGEIPNDREMLWILGQYCLVFHFKLLPKSYY